MKIIALHSILGEVLYKRIAGILFAFLIINFSANFVGITDSLFDTFIIDVENIDDESPDLSLLMTGLSAEENQEEEESEHASGNKHSSEFSNEHTSGHVDQHFFKNSARLNAFLHFNVRNLFFDAPDRPPQA
jgi:hypothetical protein